VQAEGESHATPEGLYWVETDSQTGAVQMPVADSLRFVPSPDGQKIALMSADGLGFSNADGGKTLPEVLTYPRVGLGGSAIPAGVWTQDSSAFLITSSYEPGAGMNTYAIWRVPADGSPAELLATFTGSHPDSVTFSPNGRHAAFYSGTISGDYYGWFVADLPGEQGPLAIPSSAHLFWQNVHWSPAGLAYVVSEKTLFQLCPDAIQESEVCDEGFDLGADLASIHWLDGNRFLFVTREPYDLYFGRFGGAPVRIAAGAEKFAAVAMTCRNDAEFAAGGEGPVYMSVAPDNLFQMVWRIRNTGTCTWDTSYQLAAITGERLSGPRSLRLREAVPPRGEIELSVKLTAPAAAGRYQGEWQLFAPDGRPFGVRLPVELVVPSYTVMDLPPDLILAEIPAGGDRIAFGEGAIWVLGGNNSVSRIDLDTNQVVATMMVGEFPRGLAADYDAVWVTGLGITRIDPLTNMVSATIPVGSSSGLNGIAAGAGSVWASSPSDGTVFRIDPGTDQVIATIHAGGSPLEIAITQDAVWVTDPNNPVLKRIDPAYNEISAEVNLDCATRGIAADANAIWVACDSVPTLYRIDPLTNQIVARIAVGNHSRGLAISSNGVWVTSLTDETLSVIDPATNQVMAVYRANRPLDLVAAQGELWVITSTSTWRIRP
jgi:YVTN family beta-propeller protein